MIYDLSMRHDDREVSEIAARMALGNGHLDKAMAASQKLNGLEYEHPIVYEIMLRMDMKNDALRMAIQNRGVSADAGIAFGMCLYENGLLPEASECLERTRTSMLEQGCLFRMDELLRYEAMAEKEMNRLERASALVEAALSVNRNERIRMDLLSLRDSLVKVSEDGVLLECIDI